MTSTQARSLYENADICNARDIYYFGDVEMLTLTAYKINHEIYIKFIPPSYSNGWVTFFIFNKRMDLLDVITKF